MKLENAENDVTVEGDPQRQAMVRISLKRYEQLKRREEAYLLMLEREVLSVRRGPPEANGRAGR